VFGSRTWRLPRPAFRQMRPSARVIPGRGDAGLHHPVEVRSQGCGVFWMVVVVVEVLTGGG
jgi:hypothetical protein